MDSGLCQSGRRGSNPRPLAWKANALPTELLPQFSFLRRAPLPSLSEGGDGPADRVGGDGFEPPKSKDSRFTVCPIWPLWYLPFFAFEEVCFSIAVQRYNYLFKLQTKSIIFIAVIAHSSPLLPSLPPARSSACSIVFVVINP